MCVCVCVCGWVYVCVCARVFTCFLDVFVDVLRSCRGVRDIIMSHKVNLEPQTHTPSSPPKPPQSPLSVDHHHKVNPEPPTPITPRHHRHTPTPHDLLSRDTTDRMVPEKLWAEGPGGVTDHLVHVAAVT